MIVAPQENSDTHQQARRFWTIPEAVEATKLSANFFYQRTRDGKLPGLVRFGRHVRIEVDVFLIAARAGEMG